MHDCVKVIYKCVSGRWSAWHAVCRYEGRVVAFRVVRD